MLISTYPNLTKLLIFVSQTTLLKVRSLKILCYQYRYLLLMKLESELDPRKAGLDGLCPKVLKLSHLVIASSLTVILRWLPRVLFSYNRIYRDQTLSARITREMFVGSYNKIFHIQSWKHCFCRCFCVSTHNKDDSSILQSFVFPSSSSTCFKSVLKQFLGAFYVQ